MVTPEGFISSLLYFSEPKYQKVDEACYTVIFILWTMAYLLPSYTTFNENFSFINTSKFKFLSLGF